MKIHEIRELIKLIDQSTINEFEFEDNGAIVKIKKGGQTTVVSQTTPVVLQEVAPIVTAAPVATLERPAAEVAAPVVEKEDTSNLHKITSPMVGTFYASPSPDAKEYVSIGDRIKNDSIVCIVEAMKLFNEIEAEIEGEIVEVLAKNGQLVEYGQPLFVVKA
ncbi:MULTISPECIES: acetyl-CoA carboxylase biotin carboxyl carrier protein [unclassified Bacillus (in: firmicutes)]|uniref:acetyl-CoA carboxylase biotin carboxyl carrier protein n=1 Tax=Bacillaceae TaxID=186817 RepID=UPI000BF1C89E|nr:MULTISPECIES: acetyl-CoA carboxylase biotin carboxyl carrier protein [unclassified Bacillus (in: firmicutes)]PEJ57000.1 acetyl-CoA carboxylase, biotin carboxyl carrier protein [Bacillus sp. AFS002410]PEL11267.1 acetyl-CoA carboxylase, biotin carboxyl carrier protein [Bacillus sp. AFS017336]QKE71573.1 acetyl-CoA carboxylase biotin carboxyl carrier protein [Arthrobacter citreus]